jgi:hypothetical protein
MKALDPGYRAVADRIGKAEWHRLLLEFDDANFYQTWSYGEISWGAKNISHLVLSLDGRPVAMAQLRILRFPALPGGVAYLNWGPLWRRRDDRDGFLHLKNMARALRRVYVEERGLVLRISPKIVKTEDNRSIQGLFRDEGYVQSPDPLRTFLVDLNPKIDEIRQNMHRSWKRSLKFAENQDLVVEEATDKEHQAKIMGVYSQMKSRKRVFGNTQMDVLSVHEDLPEALKLKILLCSHQGEKIAVLGWSSLGKTCIPLIGATGDQGLLRKASFLLWWEMIKSCKEKNAAYCETATVHEKRNPGGYFFKQGLAGKDAREATYVGRFDAYRNYPAFVLIKTAMAVREKTINIARQVRVWRGHRVGSSGSPSEAS